MARPRKCRRIFKLPRISVFGPVDLSLGVNGITIITVDEYESIRLIDLEGLNKDQCADVMGVTRSTIQKIYEDAHKKLADSIVNGNILKIEGGDYKLYSEFDYKQNSDSHLS